ncbi:MAG: hypothetical protein C4303_08685 [candidate division GAL15 bacterium]
MDSVRGLPQAPRPGGSGRVGLGPGGMEGLARSLGGSWCYAGAVRGSVSTSDRLRAVAEEYVRALRRELQDRLVSAVLFGSVARGEAGPISDVDLLVVAEGLPEARLQRHQVLAGPDEAVEPLLRALRREGILADVRPILKTPEEASRPRMLYLDLVEDAVLLYDRDGFFAGILERMRGSLQRLGARRIRRGGLRYWDLKPDYKPGEVFEI